MNEALLDTDILSEVLKQKDATVVQNAANYLQQHARFAISAMTRYEVLRGLKEKGATRQIAQFETFCKHTLVFPISDAVLDRTADLWAAGRKGGYPHRDADLVIAATALEENRVLITGNTVHFAWIPGLVVEDWRKS